MFIIVKTGNCGSDRLEPLQVPMPAPRKVGHLIRVGAAGVNNTEINMRIGWYSEANTRGTKAVVSG